MNISLTDHIDHYKRHENYRAARIKKFDLPYYSFMEELLNCVTHAIGALFGLFAFISAISSIIPSGNSLAAVSTSIFFVTLIIMYTNSAVYHGWAVGRAKTVFRIIDHCSIFMLIAGTYAPFTLTVMGNTSGKVIFAIVAMLCTVGVVLNLIDMKKYSKISMVCYIVTGWCIVFAFGSISAALTPIQLQLLLWGGIAYTVGAVIFVIGSKVRYMHTLWHIFVMLGSLMHYLCINSYIVQNFA